ncbi:hypothetical protein O3P69_011152 [Scylla paramamosain]|uniref:Uncharacterized protein n=1 Tax=Scylla paramamosain TaxID=85552 RepID=A0AAW0STT3_SCYPA
MEEGGVRDVDVESGRQLVQNTVALITANPGLVLVFALSIWVVWAVAVGFDPIGYLNSFGTGAPGGGGSSGGSSVVSSSSSSAVVLGALDSPPALSLPAVQGADISPVLTDGEPSPGLDDAEPSPDAESVPTDDGGTPAAESGGPSLDGTTGDTSPVSDEGSAPPPSDADNPPSDPTSTDDATASDAAAPADDDTAPETPVSDGTDADSADSGDIDADSAASDDTAADSPASDDTAADSPASDDTAADSPASAVTQLLTLLLAMIQLLTLLLAVTQLLTLLLAMIQLLTLQQAVTQLVSLMVRVTGLPWTTGTGEDPLISEGAATGEDVGDSGAATGPGVLFAGAISDATTTEGEAGSLTPAFASLRPSSTTGTTEEALLAVDGAIWEILANISSSITTTESTDGENSPPKLPPLPVPTGDLTGPSITSSYSVLHACLVLGGDVPSCVAQAAAFGEILQNKTQDSLQRPTSDDVTPSSLGTILKIHPFAEVLHSLQDGDGGAQDAVIDKTPLGDLGDNNSVILGFLRNQNVSHDLVEKVISQVNSIKDTFKDSQVLIPWKENEGEVDIGEGSPTQDQEPSDNDLQENSEDLQESSGDLPENSDNLQENSGNLQENSDLPENSDDVEENHDTLPIMLDLQGNSEGPQRNSEPPKLYSTSETLALTDTGKNTPFSSLMLQGEISVKDKENEKTGDGDEKNVDNDNERKKINEAEKNKEEMKEEEIEEEIKKDKMGLTDRRGLLIKSKYPHAEILPTKPIRFYMRHR